MGTASTKKFIKNNAGQLTEEAALTTSAGAGDADRVPALNASGLLDDTMLNASALSGANKVVKQTAAGIITPAVLNATVTSVGAADAAKMAQLDGSGRLDSSILPVGVGADTAIITTSEALVAGDLVNIWNSTGAKVRKADPAAAGKEAHGFVLIGVASGAAATVYFEGSNTAATGLTPGPQFLGATAGKSSGSAPTASGSIVQRVGFATSATAMNFNAGEPIVLA